GSWHLGFGLPMGWRSSRRQDRDAVFAQRDYELRACEFVSGSTLAAYGSTGGAERMAAVRADGCISIRDSRQGLAREPLTSRPVSANCGMRSRSEIGRRPALSRRAT